MKKTMLTWLLFAGLARASDITSWPTNPQLLSDDAPLSAAALNGRFTLLKNTINNLDSDNLAPGEFAWTFIDFSTLIPANKRIIYNSDTQSGVSTVTGLREPGASKFKIYTPSDGASMDADGAGGTCTANGWCDFGSVFSGGTATTGSVYTPTGGAAITNLINMTQQPIALRVAMDIRIVYSHSGAGTDTWTSNCADGHFVQFAVILNETPGLPLTAGSQLWGLWDNITGVVGAGSCAYSNGSATHETMAVPNADAAGAGNSVVNFSTTFDYPRSGDLSWYYADGFVNNTEEIENFYIRFRVVGAYF